MNYKALLTVGAAAAVTASAIAANPLARPLNQTKVMEPEKNVQPAYADAWARVKNGKIVGEWHKIPASAYTKQLNAAPYSVAYDGWNTNPAVLPAGTAFNANYYGTNGGNFRFGNTYKGFDWAQDMNMAPGTECRNATLLAAGVVWNPLGTDPRSGTADLTLVFLTHNFHRFGTGPATSEDVDGIAFNYTALANGYRILFGTITGGALQLPRETGGIECFVAQTVNNALVALPAPICAQPALKIMLSPGEAWFPGTNPSSSNEDAWYDDSTTADNGTTNTPDYVFTPYVDVNTTWWEYYSFDSGSVAGGGITQPAISAFVDVSRVISGKVGFTGMTPPPDFKWYGPTLMDVQINNGTTTSTVSIPLADDGTFEIYDPNQTAGGAYTLSFKGQHWLRSNITVDTTAGSVTGLSVPLINGDCDTDNVVSVFDYIHLSDNFDKNETDNLDFYDIPVPANPIGPGNIPICYADLDHDGVVSVFDYIQLSDNFDLAGNDPL